MDKLSTEQTRSREKERFPFCGRSALTDDATFSGGREILVSSVFHATIGHEKIVKEIDEMPFVFVDVPK
jgi:hypothetical protein